MGTYADGNADCLIVQTTLENTTTSETVFVGEDTTCIFWCCSCITSAQTRPSPSLLHIQEVRKTPRCGVSELCRMLWATMSAAEFSLPTHLEGVTQPAPSF